MVWTGQLNHGTDHSANFPNSSHNYQPVPLLEAPPGIRPVARPLAQAARDAQRLQRLLRVARRDARGSSARVLDRLILGQALMLAAIERLDGCSCLAEVRHN